MVVIDPPFQKSRKRSRKEVKIACLAVIVSFGCWLGKGALGAESGQGVTGGVHKPVLLA